MAAVDSFDLLYRELCSSCGCFVEKLAVVGAVCCAVCCAGAVVCLIHECCTFIRLHFIPRLMNPGHLIHRYGRWAIITGELSNAPVHTCTHSHTHRTFILETYL